MDNSKMIYIGSKQHSCLKILAARRGVTMRSLIDNVIKEYMAENASGKSLKVTNKNPSKVVAEDFDDNVKTPKVVGQADSQDTTDSCMLNTTCSHVGNESEMISDEEREQSVQNELRRLLLGEGDE